ncbi:uncharacterized protein LOC121856025 [Homarus americanus]|nr:uncharacterized protein LOC121856025 [Homarus americanus]
MWQQRLEASERNRLKRLKELEVARETFKKDMEKRGRNRPGTNNKLYHSAIDVRNGSVPSRATLRKRPPGSLRLSDEDEGVEDLSLRTSRTSSFVTPFRRESFPPPYSALERSGHILPVKEYFKPELKMYTKVKPFNFQAPVKRRHSCTIHHFHH